MDLKTYGICLYVVGDWGGKGNSKGFSGCYCLVQWLLGVVLWTIQILGLESKKSWCLDTGNMACG